MPPLSPEPGCASGEEAYSLAIVLAFLVVIALSATGLVAGNWQQEVGVPNAPPTFLGPRAAEAESAIEAPKGPNVDLSDIDPLAPRYKEWAERAAQPQTTISAAATFTSRCAP